MGFFGQLEVETYGRAGREGRSAAELEAECAEYMDWHDGGRINASLGGMSPAIAGRAWDSRHDGPF
ncbi:IS3 family transposase [Adlercreutzia mucosicola]|uniref:IS3 family transposase n=1 Tax=Adlercreutzia mucosicola TaxID=580026 RepID=UPI0034DFC43C